MRKWRLLKDGEVDEDNANDGAPVRREIALPQAPEGERKEPKQLGLLSFYALQSSADARAQLEHEEAARKLSKADHWVVTIPSPELDGILDELHAPKLTADWAHALDARIIHVPGTGGCLYLAIHACRARKLSVTRDQALTLRQQNVYEATYYKKHICNAYLEYLEPMMEAGSVTIADLLRRYYGLGPPTDTAAAMQTICEFIRGIRQADIKRMTKDQWGGDEELFALVWYVREPVFVITEAADRTTSVRVIRLDSTSSQGPERIVEYFPEATEAHAIFRLMLRFRVIPTVLHFSTTSSGDGHFSALRLNDRIYTDWMQDDPTGTAMKDRRDEALQALGWYRPPATPVSVMPGAAPQFMLLAEASAGSVYVPTSSYSTSGEMPSAPAPVAPHLLFDVHRHLNPRRRRRSALASVWDQAENLNLIAYREWDPEQEGPDVRSEADTVEAGCRYWSRNPAQLVALLRAVPYPEIAMSLLPADLVGRLGLEILDNAQRPPAPAFVHVGQQTLALDEWHRLIAYTFVLSSDSLSQVGIVDFLQERPSATIEALHALRLHDWTWVSRLASDYDQQGLNRLSALELGAGLSH